MRIHFFRLLALLLAMFLANPTLAQFKEKTADSGELELGESTPQRWQIGITVTAGRSSCQGVTGYVPVPVDWPEQEVREVEDDVSSTAKVSYRKVDDAMKLMVVKIPSLAAGKTANALVTFEVTHRPQLPPEDTEHYVIPNKNKLSRTLRMYVGTSPQIESTDRKIREVAKEIGADKEKAWEQVEAVYDWVREKVEYKKGPLKSAVATLKDGFADCEGMTTLFIAICRAKGIPARTVWVEGHCYPEFYLEEAEGKGRWFPCQIAGSHSFGGIPETRPIWQKGDRFRLPDNPSELKHYLPERVVVAGATAQPRVQFVRRAVGK
ncbi:MAG: transglutaminase family protein [Pirellulaceae bacterium]|nr:transglutaminase family protein [Pirellulaceae bacterium]